MANPVISQIVVGGVTYDIRDKIGPDGALYLVGVSKWPTGGIRITDEGSQAPTLKGETDPIDLSTLKSGAVVLQVFDESMHSPGYQEFMWMKTSESSPYGHWELLGDEGSYVIRGTYTTSVPSASTTITPTFTGTTATITLNGNIGAQDIPVSETTASTITALTFSTDYTPAGGVSASGTGASGHTFTGTTETLSSTFVPNGSVSASGTGASGHSFTGTTATITVSTDEAVTGITGFTGTPTGTISIGGTATDSGHVFVGTEGNVSVTTTGAVTAIAAHSYQPAGTISKPNVTVTPNRVAITPVTGGTGTAIATVTGEVLTIKDLPTTTFATNVTAALAAAPTFTGTTASLAHDTLVTKGTVTSTGKFKPTGDVMGNHTFSGTGVTNATFTLAKDTVTMSTTYQPAGTVKGAHSFTGSNTTASVSYQPKGTITGAHSFSGTTATISFSKKLVAKLAAATISASGEYQPAGTVSSFNIAATNHTHSVDLNS